MSAYLSSQAEQIFRRLAAHTSFSIEIRFAGRTIPELGIRSLIVHIIRPPFIQRVSVQENIRRIEICLHILSIDTCVKIATEDSSAQTTSALTRIKRKIRKRILATNTDRPAVKRLLFRARLSIMQ